MPRVDAPLNPFDVIFCPFCRQPIPFEQKTCLCRVDHQQEMPNPIVEERQAPIEADSPQSLKTQIGDVRESLPGEIRSRWSLIADLLTLLSMVVWCVGNAQNAWGMFLMFKQLDLPTAAIFMGGLWSTAVVAIDVWRDENCHGSLVYIITLLQGFGLLLGVIHQRDMLFVQHSLPLTPIIWYTTTWVMIMVGLWRRYGSPLAAFL